MRERLGYEKELLGFYVTGHPADEYEPALQYFRTSYIGEFKELEQDQILRLAGVIVQKEVRVSKEGKPYARLQLEDLTGSTEVMVFSNAYLKMGTLLEEGQPFVATGRVDKSQEEMVRFKTMGLAPLAESFSKVVLGMTIEAESTTLLDQLKVIIEKHKGKKPLQLELPSKGKRVTLDLGTKFYCDGSWDFYHAAMQLSGIKNIRIDVKELSDEPYKPRKFPTSKE
jgi:DNA polymerase-3 subunit alpha